MDVSEWQGKINWKEAKKDLDFAFVRISYGTRHLDDYYDYNMTEAEAADVPVGTYVYSLAKTNKEALADVYKRQQISCRSWLTVWYRTGECGLQLLLL